MDCMQWFLLTIMTTKEAMVVEVSHNNGLKIFLKSYSYKFFHAPTFSQYMKVEFISQAVA